MDKDTRMSPPVVGGTSLLVMFAVLCLTVFALLGLSAVQAGTRLSQATAQAVSAYYQADCQAEEIFARLRSGEVPANVTETNGIYFYTCPISDTQQLQVALLEKTGEWTVLRWQAESIAAWETDDELTLWDGTEMG